MESRKEEEIMAEFMKSEVERMEKQGYTVEEIVRAVDSMIRLNDLAIKATL
jgi:hypothetical protein